MSLSIRSEEEDEIIRYVVSTRKSFLSHIVDQFLFPNNDKVVKHVHYGLLSAMMNTHCNMKQSRVFIYSIGYGITNQEIW